MEVGKLGFCARYIYIRNPLTGLDGLFRPYIYRGGPYNVTASINVLTKGGCVRKTASVNKY